MPWDYQQTEYDKQAKADPVWHLERMINYGLDGRKIQKSLLERYFAEIRIPEDRRAFLELLLWNKKFGANIGDIFLGGELAKVRRIEALPRMIKPITVNELKEFFEKQAKELKDEVLE